MLILNRSASGGFPGTSGTRTFPGTRIRQGRVLSSKALKRSLRREPFWQSLTERRADRSRLEDFSGEIDDVPLRLVELTGEPGDVYYVDLRVLHSLSPNVRPEPRLMMTQRLLTEEGEGRITAVFEARRQ